MLHSHTSNHKLVFKDLKEVAALVVDALKHYQAEEKKSPKRTVEEAQKYVSKLHKKRHEVEKSTGSKLIQKLKNEQAVRHSASTPPKNNRSVATNERTFRQDKSPSPRPLQPRTRENMSPILQSKVHQPTIHERSKDLLKAREYRLERQRYLQDEKQQQHMLSNTFKKHSVEEWLDHLNERQHLHQQRIYQQRVKLLEDIHPEAQLIRNDKRLLMEYQRNRLLQQQRNLLQAHSTQTDHRGDSPLQRELKMRTMEIERHRQLDKHQTYVPAKSKQHEHTKTTQPAKPMSKSPSRPNVTAKKSVTPTKSYLKPNNRQVPSTTPNPNPAFTTAESAMTFSAEPTMNTAPQPIERISNLRLTDEELLAVLRQNKDKIFRIVDKIRPE